MIRRVCNGLEYIQYMLRSMLTKMGGGCLTKHDCTESKICFAVQRPCYSRIK